MNEISNSVIELYNQLGQGESMSINEEMVKKAINVVLYLHPKNGDEVFLMLCALNLLNAAIKTELFKDSLSYDLIKTNAAKLVSVIDALKNNDVSYYYNKDEYCLYLKYGDVVFSFHHVPLTSEILKASFASPISWPGIRLQKIAQPLMNLAIKSFDNDIEMKEIIEKPTPVIDEIGIEHEKSESIDYEYQDKDISNDDESSINNVSTEISTLPAEKRASIAKKILAIISKDCTPDPEGWFDLTKIAPKLKANGINYSLYGFNKLILFLEAIFGNSLQRRNVGNTMVFLRFPLDDIPNPSDITNNVERNQEDLDILNGVQLGDKVEINTYGVLKSGKVIILNSQFVQLELNNNLSVRIRCNAISSIESQFSSNSVTSIDLSFASSIIKDVLITEGLYSSSTIETNATITMVESRRIWLTTDDRNTGACYKGSIIGYNKDKLVKGQRVFVFPFKKEIVNCVILEMSYYELNEVFENLVSTPNMAYGHRRTQILRLLAYFKKKISHTESLQKLKDLRRQLKKLMPHSASSKDEILEEEINNSDETELESSHEISNDETSSVDADVEISTNEDSPTKSLSPQISGEALNPELVSTSIQGPKVVGKIDLTEIEKPKKKKQEENNDVVATKANDSISIDNTGNLLPSMGKIKKMWAAYGYIKPYNQEKDLYFYTSELVSYAGIIESPSVGDEVVYTLGQNSQGPIALCIHKQCSRDVVEDLVEKFRYDTKICSRLKKHIEEFDNLNSDTSDNSSGLAYYLEKVGVNPRTSFSPNDVEKSFAEKLSSNEYAIAIELLIDEVEKKDPSKCYNLFLRSSSYARYHKMYDVSRHLIEKALEVFKGEDGKTKYFQRLLKNIDSLSNKLSDRIEINEKKLADSLEISKHTFPLMPTYVRDEILRYKDFNGITPDKETIRTGLYKEEYIKELKDKIKQNNADELLYLTMIKLQLAFHPKEYNPKDDVARFLVNRAKNILAIGDESRYSDVRYLLRLAYHLKSFEKGFDDTIGLYLMTLGEYTVSDIDMYMRGSQNDYKFEDLLKTVLTNDVDNTLELALLTESNADIKNRIIREYDKIGKNADSFDDYPAIINEVKNRFTQYSSNPTINFMSFISYLKTTAILLDNEMNVVKNDSVKIVSYVTDFNTGQKYNVIRDAYNNIIQKIDAIIPNLIDHPTEIGYETLLPALRLLKKDVRDKFEKLEERATPTIEVEILESVELEDSKSVELKIEIRNSGDSARSVHINSLNVYGDDLAESNNINIDVTLPAGGDKVQNVELLLCDNAAEGKIAEVEFIIEYDDIYIATEQRIPTNSIICKTIYFEMKPFVEIKNKFRQCSGGEELEAGDDMFYGRDKLISDIQETILKGTKNQIAIYGQKRSGKSSLLNQIKGKLEKDESHSVICGKFNLQGLFSDDDEKEAQEHDYEKDNNPVKWILKSIAEALLRGMPRSDSKKLGKDIKDILSKFFSLESDAFTALREFIEQINTILQDSHFVIFIDEFTYLYQLIKDGRVNEDFMRRWIALIETPGINLQTIVAAQDTLPHFMNESYASNCFNKFSKEPLSYLSKEEALQLIKNPIKDVTFHNHSDELIYGYTSGSAFFTQIFCTRLVDYLNSERSNVVGKEEIEIVAERLCTGTHRLEKSTFECLIKEADGSDYDEYDNEKVLKAIAEHTRAGGYVNIEDLHIDFPQEKLKSVLDNLYDRRVISMQDKGYSINVKLFVKWILNN
ncbi:ATP-binding protein [uncultured Prevotella sp.]|uniref:ATP-binding protein n=1 Tax=uncultured Prevotella sp. TaxID=159272 RepID=UPI00258FA4F7|nr:ATP-binding protein [uncultured Prevotella sp.]